MFLLFHELKGESQKSFFCLGDSEHLCVVLAAKIMSKHSLSKLTSAWHIVNAINMFENIIESII